MAVPAPVRHVWDAIPAEQINPSITRRYLTGDNVTIARFDLKRGGIVPLHSHHNEQVSYVMSGKLTFRIDGREIDVAAGEVLQIPGGVPHEVVVVEDATVVDVFSPVRQDWLDKTDSYFQRT